jgi:hypothetical protein
MKTMKYFLLVVLITLPLAAQVKVVSFKKLQTFLPNITLDGYTREKPTGSSASVSGISTSLANVQYTQTTDPDNPPPQTITIETSISDMASVPYALTAFTAMIQANYESETETGYEKAMMVKELYPGKLSADTSETKSIKLEFAVGNRYFVTVAVNGSADMILINKMIDPMDLAALAILIPEP